MSNFISILAFISTIIFSLSQSYIIYILKRNDKEGLKITSSFSIISCLVYQWIWFIYYRKIENNNVCWCYLIGTIFSFVLSAIYLFFYSKELPQKNTLYMSLYLFMLADLIFEIWFIERDILNYEEKIQSKRNVVRIISSIFNVLMYGTFGLNIFKFFKELNMSYMALPVAIVGLFNSFIWLLYGIVNSDDDENIIVDSRDNLNNNFRMSDTGNEIDITSDKNNVKFMEKYIACVENTKIKAIIFENNNDSNDDNSEEAFLEIIKII